MSILIKGIEMPDGCRDCKFQNDTICMLIDGCWYDESNGANRRPECPLVPVPPHGRLIDADALLKTNNPVGKSMVFGGQYVYTENEIQAAPTIIEAEEGE